MKYLLLIILLVTDIFAISPFSLEGVKSFNVKVVDKEKNLPKEFVQKITKDLIAKLEKAGLKTKTDEFSSLVVKINSAKVGDTYIIHVNMFIVEDVFTRRSRDVESMGITYSKDDFFDTKDLKADVYESVIEYILPDFLEQYKEEN